MDAIHAEIKQFSIGFERLQEIWSIVKGIVWVVKNNWKILTKEYGNLDLRIFILPFPKYYVGWQLIVQ